MILDATCMILDALQMTNDSLHKALYAVQMTRGAVHMIFVTLQIINYILRIMERKYYRKSAWVARQTLCLTLTEYKIFNLSYVINLNYALRPQNYVLNLIREYMIGRNHI
jgi:predicted nucleic acid-binding protein